jgi:hypothetical protein
VFRLLNTEILHEISEPLHKSVICADMTTEDRRACCLRGRGKGLGE